MKTDNNTKKNIRVSGLGPTLKNCGGVCM